MTTYIAFEPSDTTTPPFQATLTLDGAQYNFVGLWSQYRGDWYFQITDQSGNVVIMSALIGSPDNFDIDLAPGIFATSTLVYRASTGNLEITP